MLEFDAHSKLSAIGTSRQGTLKLGIIVIRQAAVRLIDQIDTPLGLPFL